MPDKRYRVRRLTPVECARLQGFPDNWGELEQKETMSDEEVAFWNSVRQTRAAMDGKHPKAMTADQACKWHNGLKTDSSEYRMWGNGIALPNASFVIGRIVKALQSEKEGT